MARKNRDRQGGGGSRDDAPFERSLAAAEADVPAAEESAGSSDSDTRCICGSREFLLEAYLHVVDGVASPEPVEVETLTCPECGREFEAVQGESGKFLRGDLLGFAELEDD